MKQSENIRFYCIYGYLLPTLNISTRISTTAAAPLQPTLTLRAESDHRLYGKVGDSFHPDGSLSEFAGDMRLRSAFPDEFCLLFNRRSTSFKLNL